VRLAKARRLSGGKPKGLDLQSRSPPAGIVPKPPAGPPGRVVTRNGATYWISGHGFVYCYDEVTRVVGAKLGVMDGSPKMAFLL